MPAASTPCTPCPVLFLFAFSRSIFVSSGRAASTDGTLGATSDVVGILLGSDDPQEYVSVPYTRVLYPPVSAQDDMSYVEADLTIGRSTRNYIGGDSKTSYPVLSVSTNYYVDQDPSEPSTISVDSSYGIGFLHVTLIQGSYARTELTDINPLDIGGLLGNIGGFWELLLVTWGLCFIAATSQSPTYKGRDFIQPIKKGQEIVSRKRRRFSTRTTSLESEGGTEEQPYWITSRRNAHDAPGRSCRAVPPAGSRPPAVVVASSFRRPIEQDYPTRSYSNSTCSLVTGKSFMTSGGGGLVLTQEEQPADADCA